MLSTSLKKMENYSPQRMILFILQPSLMGEPHPIATVSSQRQKGFRRIPLSLSYFMLIGTLSNHSQSPQNFYSLHSFWFGVIFCNIFLFSLKVHSIDQAFTTGYFSSTFLMVEAMSSFSTERSISSSFFT